MVYSLRLFIKSIALVVWAIGAHAAPLNPKDAPKHAGESATVCGVVASARYAERSKGAPTFLNLDEAYPDQIFTAIIWGENRAKFGTPEKTLLGKKVCVTGEIRLYKTIPEIILTDPKQLQ